MPEPALATYGLTRSFGATKAVQALDLTVERGTVFGFLGPNGAGKTTTIRLLLGLLEPDSGGATVLGLDPWREGDALRARCGVLLEHDGLYLRLTARENLDFFARVARLEGAERRRRVDQVLDELDLRDRRHEPVDGWSRGMRQKLAVARALLARPEMVFLDEPTAGLDPVAAAALRADLLERVAAAGVTVFLTTHNLAEAERMCQSVGILRGGRLLACASPAELRARTGGEVIEIAGAELPRGLAAVRELPFVTAVEELEGRLRVQVAADARAAPLVRCLVEHGAAVEEVRRVEATLEEVFVGLMGQT